MHRSRRLLSVVVVAASIVVATPAAATSEATPPHCYVESFPSAITTIPANAPALLLRDASVDAIATVTGQLMKADGATTQLTAINDRRETLVLPLGGLEAGRGYDLLVAIQCSVPNPGATPPSVRIVASEPVPLPSQVGTLRMSGSAFDTTVIVDPSPELKAYLPVSVMTLTLDGAFDSVPLFGPAYPTVTFAAVLGNTCRGPDGILRGGKRTANLSVSAHVAGAATDPEPATLNQEVDCDEQIGRFASSSPAPTQSDGCSASAHHHAAIAPYLLLAVLSALLIRRRRILAGPI
jgi:uncharacterized protein (TIGR03382 family)